jgi:hypothetical protein
VASKWQALSVTEVLPLLYLHGLSTGDFVPARGQFLTALGASRREEGPDGDLECRRPPHAYGAIFIHRS